VTLKHTPHLFFKIDEAIERGSRVLSIMNELGLNEGTNV
jgi:ribosome-binding factor A